MNEMVTIPRAEYDLLRAAAEDLADLQAYDRAKAALEAGDDELIAAEYVNRLLNRRQPASGLPRLARPDAERLGAARGRESCHCGGDRDRAEAGFSGDASETCERALRYSG